MITPKEAALIGTDRLPSFKRARVAAFRRQVAMDNAAQVDQFAEHLAEGWTVSAASRGIGVSTATGRKILAGIRAGLGVQAV